MDLRDVDIFVVVAGERRFEAAARKLSLNVVQVRASMRRLERMVGAPLVVDDAGEIQLTMAGARFRFRAHQVLDGLRAAARQAQLDAHRHDSAAGSPGESSGQGGRVVLLPQAAAQRQANPTTRMRYGDVEIDLLARTVTVSGRPISLRKKEFQLLAMIATAGGQICPRERLIHDIWCRRSSTGQNTLNVHITTLRAKLGRPDLILTIRGIGYRMSTTPDVIEPAPAQQVGDRAGFGQPLGGRRQYPTPRTV